MNCRQEQWLIHVFIIMKRNVRNNRIILVWIFYSIVSNWIFVESKNLIRKYSKYVLLLIIYIFQENDSFSRLLSNLPLKHYFNSQNCKTFLFTNNYWLANNFIAPFQVNLICYGYDSSYEIYKQRNNQFIIHFLIVWK